MDIQPAGFRSERILWCSWLFLLGSVIVESKMTFSQRLTQTVRPILGAATFRWIGYLGLCAAYLQGGINKLLDFQGAIVEMNHFGLSPAPLFAVLVITLELGASLMILIGCQRWRDSLLSPHFWPCVSGNYLTAWRDSVPLTHFFNIWVLSAVF